MSIKDNLNEALKNAMKEKHEEKKLTYRMALSAIKFAEKESGKELSDDEMMALLQREIKIRNEQIADAEKSDRLDTIPPIQQEIEWLEAFLPKQLSDDEILAVIREAAAGIDVSDPKSMGILMKAVLPKVKGVAANSNVSRLIKEFLG